ncbi:phospholipase [Streptomyces sp. OfavH-34-F]|uniref:phospholipase A2 n=1 Tax=unclassified Streptomyces TaxID=2593676 RepID=UPI001EF247B5|nr:phospholipase A2 [Streptomyces sp. OfavH-34-F]MCG7527618.1 phospholipase [Streptomyces sp. OfavH-34-F]
MTTLRRSFSAAALAGALTLGAAVPALVTAAPAGAATKPTKSQKLAKMASITGDSAASQNRWFSALGSRKKASIKKYGFVWKTDGCSWAPDKLPGGYDFGFPCWRHDFGYRNYKKTVGAAKFRASHKARIDKAFLHDMNRQCGRFFWADPYTKAQRKKLKAACNKTATKYYNTVRSFR